MTFRSCTTLVLSIVSLFNVLSFVFRTPGGVDPKNFAKLKQIFHSGKYYSRKMNFSAKFYPEASGASFEASRTVRFSLAVFKVLFALLGRSSLWSAGAFSKASAKVHTFSETAKCSEENVS